MKTLRTRSTWSALALCLSLLGMSACGNSAHLPAPKSNVQPNNDARELGGGIADKEKDHNNLSALPRKNGEQRTAGLIPDRNHNTPPFLWHNTPSFEKACRQTIEALTLLDNVYNAPDRDRILLLHRTLGEDRTGYLAGLFRLLEMRDEWDLHRAFDEEMCANSYEAGDPKKPQWIVDDIRRELTPLFLKMATLLETGALSSGNLDPEVCKNTIESRWDPKDFTCSSTLQNLPRPDVLNKIQFTSKL